MATLFLRVGAGVGATVEPDAANAIPKNAAKLRKYLVGFIVLFLVSFSARQRVKDDFVGLNRIGSR